MGSNGDIFFFVEKEPSYTFIIFVYPIKKIFPGTVDKNLIPLFWTFVVIVQMMHLHV